MINRPRRLRRNQLIRDMLVDIDFSLEDLVYPLFIQEGLQGRSPIASMAGIDRLGIDELILEVKELIDLGIKRFLLFGIPLKKDSIGSEAYAIDGIIQLSIRKLKKEFKESILIITDVCMCEYTNHGHCGIIQKEELLNDESAQLMAKIALSHAEAGADIVAPSDMMDGRVALIRELLDENGYTNIGIMSYSIKYSSAYYGPFRDACDSSPQFGDRKTYQMDYRRKREYLQEALYDIQEGADIIMVKPGLAYLDILARLRDKVEVPIAVYNVSGEYSMVKAASQNAYIDEISIVKESMYAFKRAGADIIITYWAKDIGRWVKDKKW